MIIKGNKLYFGEDSIQIGSAFDDVYRIVQADIDTYLEPNGDGYAHIILKNCIFYSANMHCTLYFDEGALDEIEMDINWQNSDQNGIIGKLSIDKAVKFIADNNRAELEKSFEVFNTDISSVDFYADDLVVLTSIMKGNDNYGIKIRKSTIDDKFKYAESRGYALATKYLVDNKLKVRFMYKEEPDNDQDSGWRFFAGDEDDEYVNNPDNVGIYNIRTIAEIDQDIIPLLKSEYGAMYEREDPSDPFEVAE